MLRANDGFYYGTTSGGGAGNSGTVFRLDANGFTTLASFNTPAPGIPVITSSLDQTTHVGEIFTYLIQATNFPNSYGATGLPPGLTVSPTTGVIAGTTQFTGDYDIILSASNGGGTGTAHLTLHVLQAVPVITSSSSVTGTVDLSLTYQITATNNPTSFDAAGLPDGLVVNTGTGAITGTPTVIGIFTATVSATNAGGTGSLTVTFTINPPIPVITSSLDQTAHVGQDFNYQIVATNFPTSYDAQNLPPGLLVFTESGIIFGNPIFPGDFVATLFASNAGGTGTARLTIHVLPAVPVITSSKNVTGNVGQNLTYQITADGNPTSYGAQGLPPGLTLDLTPASLRARRRQLVPSPPQ